MVTAGGSGIDDGHAAAASCSGNMLALRLGVLFMACWKSSVHDFSFLGVEEVHPR